MDNVVVRERKATLVLGIVCTLIMIVCALISAIAANTFLMMIFFVPLILLGVYAILIYKQRYIRMEADRMVISAPFGKKRVVQYTEVGALLLITAMMSPIAILLDRQNERLIKFFPMDMVNADKAIDILKGNQIPCIDLSEKLDRWQDIDEYLPALTRLERFVCHAQISAMKNARTIENADMDKEIEKQQRFVKIMGRIMAGVDILALLFFEGRLEITCFVLVLLAEWAAYIHLYPNAYFEISKFVKNKRYIIQLPVFSVLTAVIFCLLFFQTYEVDYGKYFAFTGVYALLLFLPFALKVYCIREKTDKPRLVMAALGMLLLAFTLAFPINYAATVKPAGHETIIVKDKMISEGRNTDYYIYADWREENEKFSVTRSEYRKIQKGDRVRVCIQQSIWGLQYWTVHE